jgi:hypothetical protein
VANLTSEECKTRACEVLEEVLEVLGLENRPQVIADRQRTPAEQVPWPAGGSV